MIASAWVRTLSLSVVFALAVVGLAPSAAAGSGPGDELIRTFEASPVGSAPPGCDAPAGVRAGVVSDVRGRDSARSVRIHDPSSAEQTVVRCIGATRKGAELSFSAYPEALPNGYLFTVLGRVEGGGAQTREVFHFSAASDGRLRWYDGGAWKALAPAGTIQPGRWDTISVRIPRDRAAAHVYVNGVYVGRAGTTGGQVSLVVGYQFGGSGTVPAGDDVYIDDVSFGSPGHGDPGVYGFDASAVGAVPSGCQGVPGASAAVVSDIRGHDSPRSLRVRDASSSARVELDCLGPARHSGQLTFTAYPANVANGFLFTLLGRRGGTPGTPQPVFHFAAAANGSLRWYDGGAWHDLAPPGTLPAGQWTTVSVDLPAGLSAAEVSVGGTPVGQASTVGGGAIGEVSGFRFSGWGTVPAGDDVFIDDVSLAGEPAARTFELESLGAVPAGCQTPGGAVAATVTDTRGYQSGRSLRVRDAASTTRTEVECHGLARRGADLTFDVFPAALPNGFLLSLLGHVTGLDASQPVFHLLVSADGSLSWWDGHGWTPLTAPGTVPVGEWSAIRVQVPPGQAQAFISVNDVLVGQAGGVGMRAVAEVSGVRIAGSGTVPAGDDVFVDNLALDPPTAPVPAPSSPFDVGAPVTINHLYGTELQMPNSAARSAATGEVLVTYPGHADTSFATGTELARSGTEGAAWESAQARNPFPDEQSFYLTELNDGRLLAVNYHTFMVSGSANRRALVPTAVSADGGHSWTYRNGTMTTPQPMRPISSRSSRPNTTLGGFVLVNRVLEDPDGTLYQAAYGYYENDAKYRQLLLVSTDGGVNWTVRATIAVNPALSTNPRYEGFDEGSVVRVADGSMLAVMRTGSYQPMYYSRSTDDGHTWTTPQPLVAGPGAQQVVGIRPELTLLGNGTLVLLYGRPGMSMVAAPDGTGANWTTPTPVDHRNSGNGTSVVVGDDRLLIMGDRGAEWSHQADTYRRVWSRLIVVD